MDKYEVEVAKAGLDSSHEHVAPLYGQVQQDLLAEMALQGADIRGKNIFETQGARNYRLVRDFIATLPHATREESFTAAYWPFWAGYHDVRYDISTDDPFAVRALQASLANLRIKAPHREVGAPAGSTRTILPCYVVGGTAERLLLAAIHDDTDSEKAYDLPWTNQVMSVEVAASDRANLDNQKTKLYANVASETEFEELYSKEDRLFHLDNTAEGFPVITKKAWRGRKMAEWLLDGTLLEYNVYEHLNQLATVFGKQKELDNLYGEPMA